MSNSKNTNCLEIDRELLEKEIISLIQKETQNQKATLTMETLMENLAIDSLEMTYVLFQVEEKYNCKLTLFTEIHPRTVGDMVDAIVEAVLAGK